MAWSAAALPWAALVVTLLAWSLPILRFRDRRRRADLQLSLWSQPGLWLAAAAIVVLPQLAGLVVGAVLAAAHPDAVARAAGWGLMALGPASLPAVIAAVRLARAPRVEAAP